MRVAKYQPVLSLKPTQFAVGMVEIEYKVLEMKELKRKKLKKLIEETPIPVVVSPWKELCIIDHHHFLFSCWHAGVKEVKVKVVKDFSKNRLSYHQFWRKMLRLNYAYLYDQFGNGPRSPLYLPQDIRGLADDPYRSLAWIIRKEGGYENSGETFAEFKWADFFREKRLLESHGRRGFQDAVKKGLRILKRTDVKNLPGCLPKDEIKTDLHLKPRKKTKYVPDQKSGGPLPTAPRVS